MAVWGEKSFKAKSGESCHIRDLQVSDAAVVLSYLEVLMTDGEGQVRESGELNLTLAQEQAWIDGIRANDGELVLGAFHEDQLIGLINFHQEKPRRLRHSGAFGMSVAPEWRGRGVGTELLSALLEWVYASPVIERVELGVLADNSRAIALYRMFGFREEGRRVRFLKNADGTYVDEILMARFFKKTGN